MTLLTCRSCLVNFDRYLIVAAYCVTIWIAMWIGNEVEALYTNGPAGGAGATRSVREVLAVTSMLLQRNQIKYQLDIQEA